MEGHHEGHRDVTGGAARAAVFGVSDGLTTNVALVLGVAGANPGPGVVRLAGLAGLIGGAFSMAAGEWLSMRAQGELLERELAIERSALAETPEAEQHELAAIYRRRGIDRQTADRMADQVMADPDLALEVHAREELGVDPQHFGNPIQAAASSFASFGVGAVLPLLPWFVSRGATAVVASVVLGLIGATAVGWAVGRFTGRSAWRSILRHVGVLVVAACFTTAIGALVGVSKSG